MPERTCVGCRRKADQQSLRRYVHAGGTWLEATMPRKPGRGAYLCSRECAGRVMKNKRYPGLGTAASHQKLSAME